MTARQDSLFAPADLPPRKGSAVAPAVQAAGLLPRRTPGVAAVVARGAPDPTRPDGWRPVTDPAREHACRDCAGAATCGVGGAWYCVAHARARGFFAGSRQAGGGR